jgi:hypothetical protein
LAIYSKMREKITDLSMELMMKREAKQRDFWNSQPGHGRYEKID